MADIDRLGEARRRARRAEYVGRINRVIDYIEANLAGDLSLSTLAGVAAFSPFHFHRVFKAIVGENLSQYIRRLRVEKAASLLAANPARSITAIALESGFSSPAAFARVFRETFGMSASQWVLTGPRPPGKDGQQDSKQSQALRKSAKADNPAIRIMDPVTKHWTWRLKMDASQVEIEVKDVPEMHVAYLRHIGPYAGDSALFGRLFQQLFTWAGPRGLVGPQTQVVSLYDDDPDITEETKTRVDVAISVPPGTNPDGEIGTRTVPAGKYAVGHFKIQPDQYGEAWDVMMAQWLPESGYQPAEGPCLEMYLNDPSQDPEGKHVVDIYVPVKPL